MRIALVMKKVLFHLNTLEQGGVERVVSNLANHFAGTYYDIIVATQWYSEDEFALKPLVKRIHVGLKADDERKSRFVKVYLRIKYLRKLIIIEKPDVVIAFDRNTNYRAIISSLGLKTPVIISIRNSPTAQFNSILQKLLASVLFPKASGCVFQTNQQRSYFSKRLQRKSRVILNPINPKYINVTPPSEKKKEIVHSSRLEERKNQAGIVRAFIKLHDEYPDYTLKIFGGDTGDGTKKKLKRIITENYANDYIKLMGRSDSLETELSGASIFVFNSDWEGLPNALMEAMALGLPVISTDCPSGGPATLITDKINGMLIPVRNDVKLEEAMRYLLNNPDIAEKMGQAARRISDKCNIAAISNEWCVYIDEIICNQ